MSTESQDKQKVRACFSEFVEMFMPPVIEQPVAASDGILFRSEWGAFLHDLLELKWKRLLPRLQDAATITATRCELRLSQSELAREAAISESLLAKIERGERRITEPAVNAIWGAMWRLHQAQQKTPPAVEVLVRLDQEMNAMILTERVPL